MERLDGLVTRDRLIPGNEFLDPRWIVEEDDGVLRVGDLSVGREGVERLEVLGRLIERAGLRTLGRLTDREGLRDVLGRLIEREGLRTLGRLTDREGLRDVLGRLIEREGLRTLGRLADREGARDRETLGRLTDREGARDRETLGRLRPTDRDPEERETPPERRICADRSTVGSHASPTARVAAVSITFIV